MATFSKFNDFVQQLGLETHLLTTDTLKLALFTSTYTPAASDTTYGGISGEVAGGNGYTAGGNTLANQSWANSAGTSTLDADDTSWTASGGSITYRYLVLYNDTSTNKNLIAYWDEGSDVTIADGETRTINFDASGLLTIS